MKKTSGPKARLPKGSDKQIEFLAAFTRFEGKTEKEAFNDLFSPFGGEGIKVLAGILSSLFDTGTTFPEWVKRASQKMLELMDIDNLKTLPPEFQSVQTSQLLGKAVGISEQFLKKGAHPSSPMGKLESEIVIPFINFSKNTAANEEPEAAAAFFEARKKAGKSVEKIKQPAQRLKIYAVIALRWEEVQTFKSTGEFHAWLLSLKGKGGKRLIAPGTDSRETRKICKEIGLTFENQWGKKQKQMSPAASMLNNKGKRIS